MKTITFLSALFLFWIHSWGQTAGDIYRKSVDAISFESMEMTATLKTTDGKGNERIRQISSASKKSAEVTRMIMKFIAPADIKGTAILIYDYDKKSDDMWIYMPALRKTRRIVSTDKGKSFMGSEFSNADMSKPNADDFVYKLLGMEETGGKKCNLVEVLPKSEAIAEEYGFTKKVAWIDQENWLCLKTEIYDSTDKLIKMQLPGEYKKQAGGKFLAFRIEMKNLINGRNSVLTIDSFRNGSTKDETDFSPNSLGK